jgi:hypothetical protein
MNKKIQKLMHDFCSCLDKKWTFTEAGQKKRGKKQGQGVLSSSVYMLRNDLKEGRSISDMNIIIIENYYEKLTYLVLPPLENVRKKWKG